MRTVRVQQNKLYAAAYAKGVFVFDISTPVNPVQVASYDTPWSAWSISPVGDLIHVADVSGGLITLRMKDATVPSVVITYPVFEPTYSSTSSFVTLAGTSEDDRGATHLIWSNDRGGSRELTPAAEWNLPSVQLYAGDNVISVTATDAAGNRSVDSITVSYQIPDATKPLFAYHVACERDGKTSDGKYNFNRWNQQ